MRNGIVACLTLLGFAAPALAQEYGCAKDTDCKGDRICVQNQCVAPQNSPPAPPTYQPPPPTYQPPPPTYQPQYPPPGRGYAPGYYGPRRYRNQPPPQQPPLAYDPVIWGYSGMLAFLGESDSAGTQLGVALDGFAELGARVTPLAGLVVFVDGNVGLLPYASLWTATLGAGLHFGQVGGLTVGPGIQILNEATPGAFILGAAPAAIAHLSLPLWGAWGFHLQASLAIYQGANIYTLGAGFGWAR